MNLSKIGDLIYVVRGQRIILDQDLARLYDVPTKALNLAVKRNILRFPPDFMFILNPGEALSLRFQNETSSWGGRRYPPRAFTEQGVAMLSSVLKSERAIRVNIEIMRAFVRLRRALAANKKLARRLDQVEKRLKSHDTALGEHAVAIRSVFEDIRRLMAPPEGPRRRIGFQG